MWKFILHRFDGKPVWLPWVLIVCLLFVVSINFLRFVALDKAPLGFQIDESAAATACMCLGKAWVTPRLTSPGIFIDLNFGSPKPPTYSYPGALWVDIFGGSIASVRAFSAFWGTLGILGIFFLGLTLWGWRFGLIAVVLATASPWLWMFSRVAYESIIGPVMLVWGLFFFFRAKSWWDWIWSALFAVLSMYSYPPMRMLVPLVLVPAGFYQYRRGKWDWRNFGFMFASAAILLMPLIYLTLKGSLQFRFNEVSIFNTEYLNSIGKTATFPNLFWIFISNFFAHFNPRFLFLSGDPNWIHSTQKAGILDWGDTLGILAAIVLIFNPRRIFGENNGTNHRAFLGFCLAGYLLGIVPSSLTYLGIPHALRSIGSWPFAILAAGYGIWRVSERWPVIWAFFLTVTIVFSTVFLSDYFTSYPQRSKGMFSYIPREVAENAKTDSDWQRFMLLSLPADYQFQYYLMQYHGESCAVTRLKWQKLRVILNESPY